jgi:hypothetical protein
MTGAGGLSSSLQPVTAKPASTLTFYGRAPSIGFGTSLRETAPLNSRQRSLLGGGAYLSDFLTLTASTIGRWMLKPDSSGSNLLKRLLTTV